MKTKEILEIAGAGLIIGLGVLAVKKLLEKTEKEEEKLILGTFKYPGEVESIVYVGNDFGCISVNDKLVYYSEKMPNPFNLKNENIVNLERRAEELVINLKDIVISDIHTLTIEKKEDGYYAMILSKSTSKITLGYLLKEEEG